MKRWYIHCAKSKAPPIFLLKQFSNYSEGVLLNVKIFIWCETLHEYLNENLKIHVILRFCHIVMSFRDLTKLLAITLESSESNPQHLETNLMHFSYKIVNIYLFTQSCKQNRLTPLCFLVNSRSHILANSIILK